ncbi:MAG: bifunctional adenosylcobinamide kinase/adenosylcobinamide-phosphate guanylyltransferase [Schwartzia sp.]|nr:bifunctional adenosylcobinamide kinase/adenosylcobinamide-phosphate guanylyltransferase [Schwartzia sp. (in: firmicutes)]
MGKIILVTGGARSGKSRFAEQYVARVGQHIGYIATAEVYDEEMAFRVKLHRQRRPAEWKTYEAPLDAHVALREAGRECDAVLFDCLTLYMSNIICSLDSIADSHQNYSLAKEKLDALIDQAKANRGTTVFVTNEVGSGIVPGDHLSREYRDVAGIANQWMARAADEVYLVVCGLAVNIKKLAEAYVDESACKT